MIRLSKIETVRRSVQKIKSYLKKHHLHFVFFNTKSWGKSTQDRVSHETIFEELDQVTCSGTTDFSCIIPTMEHQIGEDTISIIISDGYHTTLNNDENTLENVKEKLLHKFNYAIGMGSEFDHDLLSAISQQTIISNSQHNIFDFLFTSTPPKTTKIPSDTFFVCNTNYIVNSDIHHSDENLSDIPSLQHSFCKEYTLIENMAESRKKTYLFVLDVSGSMDDSFLYSNNNDNYNIINNHYIETTDPYLFDKFKNDTVIQIPYLPQVGFKLLVESDSASENQDLIKLLDERSSSAADEIFITCKCIYELRYMKTLEDRMSFLYKLAFDKQYHNSHVSIFVQHTYNNLLTATEKTFNVLLHTPIHEIRNLTDNQTTEPITNVNRKCKICFQKDSCIVLSCLHSVSCFDCTLGMIHSTNLKLQCPICREQILWARQLYFRKKKHVNDDERSCLRCEINLSDVFYNPCSHILFCSKCSNSNIVKCQICALDIKSSHKIIQS